MPVAPSLPDQYHFLLPAWGEKYINVFLAYSLPSHLSAGNLGALPADATLLRIYTRGQDIEVFRRSPLFRQYEKEHAVEFETIDDLQLVPTDPYRTLTACQERGLKAAEKVDAAFFFLNPDAVYSDGTYAAILDHFRRGKRAVLTQGLRANLPAFADRVDALRPPSGEWPGLSPRRLARLVLDTLHPLSVAHVVEGDGNKSLGSYYWRVGNDGMVCRCFHLHPMAVRPLNKITRLFTTVDHEYVRMSCPDPNTVHLVTDSDEIIVVELSAPNHLADWVKTANVTDEEILAWMADWTNGYHRAAMRRTLVIHAAEKTSEFGSVERAADRFASGLLAEFHRRHPGAGPELPVVRRAIEMEAQMVSQAAAAMAAAEAEAAASAVAAREAGLAAREAALAAREAALASPVPARVPLPRRLWNAFGRLSVKAHRLLNRPLYDRHDRLTLTTRTLIEQRQIDDERVRRTESQLGEARAEFDRQRQAATALAEQLAAAERRAEEARHQQAEDARRLTEQTQRRFEELQQQQQLHLQQLDTRHQQLEERSRQLEEQFQRQFAAAAQHHADATLAVDNRLTGTKYTHDRLLTLLSRSGVICFTDRDPERTTSQPPLGYADYDMASLVYRTAFERVIRYLQGNALPGCVAEFGTYRGFTAQTFAELLRDTQWPADLYLYDSFAGLPAPTGGDATSYEFRREAWVEGAMAPETDIVDRIRASVGEALGLDRLTIHPGFFEDSLPPNPPRERIAVLHIDADLYSSARFVLQHLADVNLLMDGGVILMDDYNCNAANPNMGERKALTDFLADNPKWTVSPWFAYGWHGQAYFLHDATVG